MAPGLACALALCAGTTARADTFLGVNWTAFGASPHPAIVFTINANLTVTTTIAPGVGPFDGIEDTYVGVINNSAITVNSFVINGPAGFVAFDLDGIDTFGAPGNALDPTGYGGPHAHFSTNGNAALTSATVFFVPGIAAGSHDFFSVELAPSALGGISGGGVNASTPVPTGLVMAGMGALSLFGYGWRRRKPQAA
jgi:hypothetical protein